MRKIAILCGLVATFLCIAQSANAQYAPSSLRRDHGNLVDARGNILSDAEVLNLVGEQVYNETYVGAKKQYKIGHKLVWGGVAGTVVGLGAMVGGQSLFANNTYWAGNDVTEQTIHFSDEGKGMAGLVLCVGGLLMTSLSSIALEVGIPFTVIGKKRLDWVASNYTSGGLLTYHVGATPNGVGIALNF